MAKSGSHVIWHGDRLLLQIKDLNVEQIDKLALEVIATSEPPVDTGYLDASAYVNSSSGLNTFDETWQAGLYLSRKTGRQESRASVASPEQPPEDGAVAGWAAEYAIHVEERTSFIYTALQHVSAKYT